MHQYVGECVDCETGKGRPGDRSGLPGNLQSTYPFQIIALDHIPSWNDLLKETLSCYCGLIFLGGM